MQYAYKINDIDPTCVSRKKIGSENLLINQKSYKVKKRAESETEQGW